MENHFEYTFTTPKSKEEVFAFISNPRLWWVGLYEETMEGAGLQVNEEFSYWAGQGMHYSKQKCIERVENKTMVWEVTESKLTFLENTSEWTGTFILFALEEKEGKTKVTFTHKGLVPAIECYEACSNGWTGYLQIIEKKLN